MKHNLNSENNTEAIRKEAWQDGYEAALQKVKNAMKLHRMGLPDCEIVKRTDLPPTIIHGITGGEHDG